MEDKELINEKKNILIDLVTDFCDNKLNEEYKKLSIGIVEKMSRKRNVPFLSGKLEIWAGAVVYAIGQINFLFDRSFEPHQSADDICNFFRVNNYKLYVLIFVNLIYEILISLNFSNLQTLRIIGSWLEKNYINKIYAKKISRSSFCTRN